MTVLHKPLCRRSTIRHPLGGAEVTTPLLIPSFSSKGFRVDKHGASETQSLVDVSSEWITDAFLVSAYDLHHGHIKNPRDFRATPELIIVDSGGYEMRIEHDLASSVHAPHVSLPWDEKRLIQVLDDWEERFPAVFVSFDSPDQHLPLDEQVAKARALFSRYPKQLHTFLLKPTTRSQIHLDVAIAEVQHDPNSLKGFDFIGVTEKELGSSPLDRMVAIKNLRETLDSASILAPIHVFGALDPMTSSLYFLAGAEVFDGLTWLRYGFDLGAGLYQINYGFRRHEIGLRDEKMRARMLSANVFALEALKTQMQQFVMDLNFNRFDSIGLQLENHFDVFRAKVNS